MKTMLVKCVAALAATGVSANTLAAGVCCVAGAACCVGLPCCWG